MIIKPIKTSANNFSPFGLLIEGANNANYQGEGWRSRFPLTNIDLENAQLGWVESSRNVKKVKIPGMEREPKVELIIPTSQTIVHVVSKPHAIDDPKAQPIAKESKAFIVEPGKILVMHPGTWHYATLPLEKGSCFYYFITMDHPREKVWENVAWIPFIDDVLEVDFP